ncbi:DUF443 family protein [Oceanobacillus sp. FSL W7-1293]|uniref:DUF443 family protein n=1 Tax=Oceanobacillus sp. FSL W7-1293 TaxID=2921699 RepID=UPI0030CD9C60
MEGKVESVIKNLRYRFLIINQEYYLIDIWQSMWQMLIPFSFWIFPKSVYKVQDTNILKKLKKTDTKQGNTSGLGILGAGIGVVIANLLRMLGNYFELQSSYFVNVVIAVLVLVMVFLLFGFISRVYKSRIYKVVKLDQLPKERLCIKPKSSNHFFVVLLYYFVFLCLTLFAFIGFVQLGDVLIVIFMGLFMSVFLVANILIQLKGDIIVNFK